MATKQGDVALLNQPIATELLRSTIPARFAYTWLDGTPRVVPIWFHWNGKQIVLGTPLTAPKMKALVKNPKVALTIDTNSWPPKVLQIRGTARTETVEGVVPEYAAAAQRLLWQGSGASLGRSSQEDVSSNGPNHSQSGMGEHYRLRKAFPKRDRSSNVALRPGPAPRK